MDGPYTWWMRLPEAVRWILYAPVLLGSLLVIGFVFLLVQDFQEFVGLGNSPFWAAVARSVLMSWLTFPIAIELAPRRKKVAGWVIYVLVMTAAILGIVRRIGRDGSWDLLRDAPPLAQWAVWLLVGTLSFRHALKNEGFGALRGSL